MRLMTRSLMTKSWRISVLVFLLILSSVLWRSALLGAMHLAFSDDAYTHILLILPLSAALVFFERKSVFWAQELDLRFGPWLMGIALAMLGVLSWKGISGTDPWLSLTMFSLVTWWIGAVLCFCGATTFRALIFPLCFLYWMVPMPTSVVDGITATLQSQSAFAARLLFQAAGVPVVQDGIVLSIRGWDIEVARQCSSIRSSILLLISTMVLAHLFLRSLWRKVLLIAAAVPLAAAKNGLRVFTIAELGTGVDPQYFEGRLHHQGGIVFLGISLAAVFAMLWVLHRSESWGSGWG